MRQHLRTASVAAALACAALGSSAAEGEQAGPLPGIEQKTGDMQRIDGFVPLHWDDRSGHLYMELSRFDQELLYSVSLATGIGSNDIGLDRGKLGGEHVVVFERVGPRVLMIEQNHSFRALSDNPEEQRAVTEAFARSALWGFAVVAESAGRVLVDATSFALQDAHGIAAALDEAGQGTYTVDAERSAVFLSRTRGFPKNTEIEATLTFAAGSQSGDGAPGAWVRSVTPTAKAVTVRQRQSFVELPPPGYRPRRSHPAAGYFGIAYRDHAAPLGQPLDQRFIARHRLEKKDPGAAISEPVEPIVYYLDPGTPEPVRSALLDGARWWNAAYEAAGFRDAFRVEMLPEGADPLDVRYNVIQWVHRSTRGWSYGSTIWDPRTGEIIKGHVSLGSLRVRQDYLIAEGLLAPYATGDENPEGPARMALARIRQLAAHEVGHTLGLNHNYIASAQGRASVMDYPHPLATLDSDGRVDLSDAYGVGIAAWDETAIRYGYSDFPEGTDEEAALMAILDEARGRGITFLADEDARPVGSAHPQAHLWDNGEDAAAELERVLEVRRVALGRFGDAALRRGRPLATLEEVLVPVYLHHRYQLEAAVKVVAGVRYEYAMRGDGLEPSSAVPADQQLRALESVLRTLEPAELALPRGLLSRIPPRPVDYPRHRELFPRLTGSTFDPLSPASVAADLSLALLLHPERATRLVAQHAVDPSLPGLADVLDRLVDKTFGPPPADSYEAEIGRGVQRAVVSRLERLATEAPLAQVRALSAARLEQLADDLDAAEGAHARDLTREIRRHLDRPASADVEPAAPALPPGSPIGTPARRWLPEFPVGASLEPVCSAPTH